jgi:hypothetical protein
VTLPGSARLSPDPEIEDDEDVIVLATLAGLAGRGLVRAVRALSADAQPRLVQQDLGP